MPPSTRIWAPFTYADASLFGTDLLQPLHALGGQRVPAYRQSPGATWTIAAMVATQCGVPLTVYSEGDVRHDGNARTFLAGATCLGDILQAYDTFAHAAREKALKVISKNPL